MLFLSYSKSAGPWMTGKSTSRKRWMGKKKHEESYTGSLIMPSGGGVLHIFTLGKESHMMIPILKEVGKRNHAIYQKQGEENWKYWRVAVMPTTPTPYCLQHTD